jgi:hypothetical protein
MQLGLRIVPGESGSNPIEQEASMRVFRVQDNAFSKLAFDSQHLARPGTGRRTGRHRRKPGLWRLSGAAVPAV